MSHREFPTPYGRPHCQECKLLWADVQIVDKIRTDPETGIEYPVHKILCNYCYDAWLKKMRARKRRLEQRIQRARRNA